MKSGSLRESHSAAMLAGYFLGGAAALFSVFGGFRLFAGDKDFELNLFGWVVDDSKMLLLAPFLMFVVAYVLVFVVSSVKRLLSKETAVRPEE